MPLFNMVCESCGAEKQMLLKQRGRFACSACVTGWMEPRLPSSIATVTKEMKDPHRGVSHAKGLKQQLTKRMNQHHDSHEVAQKIDDHGIDAAKRLGWDKKMKRT